MKRTKFMIAVATALCASSVLAAEIYKYTDEDGNVHYGDRPSGNPTEETVFVASKRTDNTAVRAAYSERFAPQAASAETADSAESDEPTRAERRAAAVERAQECESYRARMETILTSRRLYREDDNGERVYLGDEERQEARNKVQELIEENCD